MGQSISQLFVHLVFCTKYRQRIIPEELEPRLHSYIGGILRTLECPAIQINSVPDHIHILFKLSKNLPLAKVVQEVKKESSKWMKAHGVENFTWQVGYGAFSVTYYKVEVVKNYIARQKVHHKIKTVKEEFEQIVKDHNISEYNETYFWD